MKLNTQNRQESKIVMSCVEGFDMNWTSHREPTV